MSENQDEVNINSLVNAFNTANFEGMKEPKGELNDLYREITNHTIMWSDDMRDDFRLAYDRDRNALRDSLIAIIRFSNIHLRKLEEQDMSQKENIDRRIIQNKELIQNLSGL